MSPGARFLLALVKAIVFIYGFVTRPVYYLYYRVYRDRQLRSSPLSEASRARVVARGGDELTYRGTPYSCRFTQDMLRHPDNIDTMDKVARWTVSRYGRNAALGTRTLLSQKQHTTSDGKTLLKVEQGEYSWIRFLDLDRLATNMARGLMEIASVKPRDKICIFADTRAEWLTTAWACFKNSVALVTIYTNLGDDGIAYGINQTAVTTVVTSAALLPKLDKIREQIPTVKTIIFFESQLDGKGTEEEKSEKDDTAATQIPYSKVLSAGSQSALALSPPNPEDLAILMYTSGSTGNPKGVLLTHGNLVSALQSLTAVTAKALERERPIVSTDESYIAFLPLAHVLELLAEHVMLVMGIKIGYSSPFTLTDKSTMVAEGDRGDCTVLRPTCMASVPLIVDRIYKALLAAIASKGEFSQALLNYCVNYRRKWVARGYDTPLVNALVFAKFKSVVGGRLKIMLCGGAPLAPEPQRFISTCLGIPLMQGYGLTETASTACVSDAADLEWGQVGCPLMGVHLKIANWDEGGYTVKDQQGARGEIVIGGNHVAAGYYRMEEKTREDFYDEDGIRYFRTGDIGQVLEGGRIKIVDRKKDLVKLQAGEYVSLGKVESNLKINPMVDSVCVYADSMRNAVVALVVPDDVKLRELAAEDDKRSREELCTDPTVVKKALAVLQQQGRTVRLEKFEIPRALTLLSEPWSPESGLVTAAFKLKRKPIQTRYQADIDRMYTALEAPKGAAVLNIGDGKELNHSGRRNNRVGIKG